MTSPRFKVLWFKVLVDGKSCHDGDFAYSLPNGKPGDWHEIDGTLDPCSHGFHLTHDPAQWWKNGATLFVAKPDYVACRIFRSGSHEVTEGIVTASGSASVTASGSASVTASHKTTTIIFHGEKAAVLELADEAVVIDRRVTPPKITTAWKKSKKARKPR